LVGLQLQEDKDASFSCQVLNLKISKFTFRNRN
jgi:hypothetical protein